MNLPVFRLDQITSILTSNNEQVSIDVLTAMFCFTHSEHHLIKLESITIDQRQL